MIRVEHRHVTLRLAKVRVNFEEGFVPPFEEVQFGVVEERVGIGVPLPVGIPQEPGPVDTKS